MITSGGPLRISVNCTKWNPHYPCITGRQTLQDLPPSGGEVRVWMSELQRACSSSCPVPSSSTEPSLGQDLSRPLPRTGADKNVTVISEVSYDRQWLPTGLAQLPRVSLLLDFCFRFSREPDQQGPAMMPGSVHSTLLLASSFWVVSPGAGYRRLQTQEEKAGVVWRVATLKSATHSKYDIPCFLNDSIVSLINVLIKRQPGDRFYI